MEADQETAIGIETTVGHKHASSTAIPSPTVSDYQNHRQRSSSNPQDGTHKHSTEHDSLITVRLSEPPARQLTLNTSNLSLNGSLVNRRSAFANILSPGPLHSPFNPDEGMSPVVAGLPGIGYGQNLQDELDDAQEDDDSKTISGPEAEDSDDEVDWDQLQKTEDAESRDNEEDVGYYFFLWSRRFARCIRLLHLCRFANCRIFSTDYCYAIGSVGTGKRQAGYEPEEHQSEGCR